MCNPALVAAGLMAGSAYMSNRANQKVADAREDAVRGETSRQDAYQRDAIARFGDTQNMFTRGEQDSLQQRTTDERSRDLIGNVQKDTLAPSAIPLPGSAPTVVRSNLEQSIGDATKSGEDFAGRLAAFGAFDEGQFSNNRNLNRSAQDLNRLASFSAGSNRILPLELAAANQKGSRDRQLADIFGAGGQVAGAAAATGVGSTWPYTTPRTDSAGRILGPV